MRIAIVSDTHSRHRTVEKVMALLAEENVSALLHCGDIEDPETVALFKPIPTHYVLGNCDIDTPELRLAIKEAGATLHEPFGHLELDGRTMAWTHGDNLRMLLELEQSDFDFVFYGHTHHAQQHRTRSALIVNPGALHRARVKTFVVLDLKTGRMESVVVE
jgi:putative phosphoesterase